MFQVYCEKAFMKSNPSEIPEAAIIGIPVNIRLAEDFHISGCRMLIFRSVMPTKAG